MTTQIIAAFDQTSDYQKVIAITHGEFTIHHWVATLSIEEQQEWQQQHYIHDAAVCAAVAAGDAEVHTVDEENVVIKWRNQEIHLHWMNTISAEDHVSYHSFWTRYLAAMAERNA